MSIRGKFVEQFGEDQARAIEDAAACGERRLTMAYKLVFVVKDHKGKAVRAYSNLPAARRSLAYGEKLDTAANSPEATEMVFNTLRREHNTVVERKRVMGVK